MSSYPKAARIDVILKEIYERRCRSSIRGFPVLLHLEDTSFVLYRGKERSLAVNPARESYDLLKVLSHLPLAIQLGAEAKELLRLLPDVTKEVEQSPLTARDKKIQANLLSRCRDFLTKPYGLDEFCHSLLGDIQWNLRRAAELRVQGMHEQMQRWAQELGRKNWNELRIVIVTSPMARRENLPELYFRWLLGDTNQARIFKVEGIESESEALRVFGVHQVDSEIGRAFFDDAQYMHRDLLSPGLPDILKDLPAIRF